MKIRVIATVTYEWTENASDWREAFKDFEDDPTEQDLLEVVRDHCDTEPSYILEGDPKSIKLELA